MSATILQWLRPILKWIPGRSGKPARESKLLASGSVRILKTGKAERVHFYYPGEDGTFIENPVVILYENGIVHIRADHEESTTNLLHCEIIWKLSRSEERSPTRDDSGKLLEFPRRLLHEDEPPLDPSS
jgi:hypothetical protein